MILYCLLVIDLGANVVAPGILHMVTEVKDGDGIFLYVIQPQYH